MISQHKDQSTSHLSSTRVLIVLLSCDSAEVSGKQSTVITGSFVERIVTTKFN